jgi:hypothetical protein
LFAAICFAELLDELAHGRIIEHSCHVSLPRIRIVCGIEARFQHRVRIVFEIIEKENATVIERSIRKNEVLLIEDAVGFGTESFGVEIHQPGYDGRLISSSGSCLGCVKTHGEQ